MTTEELLSVLKNFNDVYLSGGKGEAEIEPQMSVILKKDGSDYKIKLSGYTVRYGGKERKIKPEKLIARLSKFKLIENGKVKLAGIGHGKISYGDYLAENDFLKIDMVRLLDKYGDIANAFSLTCPYNGADGETYNLSDELAEIALKEITGEMREASRERLKTSSGLPPFDELYAEIEEEYRLLYKEKEEFAKSHDGHIFLCDEFARGKTKYKKPSELWHVYHNAEFAGWCARRLEEMKNSAKKRELCAELEDEEVLKQNLEDIKASFSWHCTTSSELSKTFYFTLNDETKKWLLRHKTDYDFTVLQDLAFYNDGDILFSSCTHERFHTDLSKK